ncbi:Iigp1 [Symbiodinium sp. CCMP2592]|nr:Iigp1 [Symbiodinium sp. CCMP2592]
MEESLLSEREEVGRDRSSCYAAIWLCCHVRSRGRWDGCGRLTAFFCLFTVAFWIGVTRNLYCNPDALRDVEPPFNGQLLPANFTLVERKYLLIQFTKLVDVYDDTQKHVGYFYDINLFIIMRFGFSDANGRIWFEARYASFLSRFKPIIEYNVQRCDAGGVGRPSTLFELKEVWWIESYWRCFVNCSRLFNLAERAVSAQVRETLIPEASFGLDPKFQVSFDGWLAPTLRGQITGPVSSFGTGVRQVWSMHLQNATTGRLVAKAQQHFVIGSATQDMRVLSRWKVETLIPSQLPNWVIGFLAVLDDIEEDY